MRDVTQKQKTVVRKDGNSSNPNQQCVSYVFSKCVETEALKEEE